MCILSMLGARAFGYSDELKPSPSAYDIWAKHERKDGDECFGDIADLEKLRNFADKVKPDVVLHLAAQPLVLESYDDPIKTLSANVMGTANVMEVCRYIETLKSVIIVTTDKVYKVGDQPKAYDEQDPLGGNDVYSASKAACELVFESYRLSFFQEEDLGRKVGVASVRAGNVVGGGDWADNRLIPDLIRAQKAGEQCLIRHPHATRPWQHVLDPLHGYLMLAEKLACESGFDGAWNFGPDASNVFEVKGVVDQVCTYFEGLDVVYEDSQTKAPVETKFLAINSAKAQEQLGWSSALDFERTIEETCRWYDAKDDEERKTITQQQIGLVWKV